jgi:hypothetical protein
MPFTFSIEFFLSVHIPVKGMQNNPHKIYLKIAGCLTLPESKLFSEFLREMNRAREALTIASLNSFLFEPLGCRGKYNLRVAINLFVFNIKIFLVDSRNSTE